MDNHIIGIISTHKCQYIYRLCSRSYYNLHFTIPVLENISHSAISLYPYISIDHKGIYENHNMLQAWMKLRFVLNQNTV